MTLHIVEQLDLSFECQSSEKARIKTKNFLKFLRLPFKLAVRAEVTIVSQFHTTSTTSPLNPPKDKTHENNELQFLN